MSLLEVKNLKTSFFTDNGEVKAVNDVSFTLEKGKVLGIVGESGSGKSVTAYSIMQILSHPGRIVSGSIKFKTDDMDEAIELVGCSKEQIESIRGNLISIIFQDPMTSLNPVYTIGNQLEEAVLLHTDRTKAEAKERVVELLELVGINEPEKRVKQYPHELSGGMRQRVMIAMALACEPAILIADEPTTALDVTIQAQILELMMDIQKKLGMAIILITHDLGVVAGMCDEVIVMYAGKVAESGTADDVFYNPQHEYTKGLLKSIPNIADETKERLVPITGTPVDMLNLPDGCSFSPRCENCMKICLTEKPPYIETNEGHTVSCWQAIRRGLEDGSVELKEEGAE